MLCVFFRFVSSFLCYVLIRFVAFPFHILFPTVPLLLFVRMFHSVRLGFAEWTYHNCIGFLNVKPFIIEKGILFFHFAFQSFNKWAVSWIYRFSLLTLNLTEMMAEKKIGKRKEWHCATVNGFFHASVWLIVDEYNPVCLLISLSADGALIDSCAGIHFVLLRPHLPFFMKSFFLALSDIHTI